MPEANTPILVHIGAIRDESLHIMQTAALPTFIATLENVSGKVESLKDNVPKLFVSEHPITPQGDDAVLYEYSLSEFNSLAPISGLKKLYPGLVEKQHRTVETHTLESALKAHQLDSAPIVQLIIEQLESGQTLLKVLEAQGLLHSLIKLWVRTSPESLYDGMPTQAELIATCEQLGFEIANTHADDPDFVLVELKRNPLYSEYKKLQEKAAKLGQREKDQTDANEKTQAEIAQLKQAHEKLTQQHAEQKQAYEKLKQQHAELKQAHEKLTQQHAEQKQAYEKLKQQHAEQKQALEKAQHDAVEYQKKNEQLKKALDENAVLKEKAVAEISQLKQEREKLTKQQEVLREQLSEQRQSNQALEAEMQATQTRQNKLAIELERAEAQLDLIKDLLLKDKLLQR